MIAKDLPFVGNKLATFEADNCIIRLTAAHMSFEMSINYITKEFDNLLDVDIKKKKQTLDNAL